MRLETLLRGTDVLDSNVPLLEISGASYFASRIRQGWAYVVCDVAWMKGSAAIEQALRRGAAVIVAEPEAIVPATCPVIRVRNALRAYSRICATFYGHPHRQLELFVVAGARGKTTTCHLLAEILRQTGHRVGAINTIERRIGEWGTRAPSTTPEPGQLHFLFSRMRFAGVTHVVLEASSIGIAEERLVGLSFAAVCVTNVEHPTSGGDDNGGDLWAVRRLLLDSARNGKKPPLFVINGDDARCAQLTELNRGRTTTFGLCSGDLIPQKLMLTLEGSICGVEDLAVRSPLLAEGNAYNILAAIGMARAAGCPTHAIEAGIEQAGAVPGRLQRISASTGNRVQVIVDCAHTPDGIGIVLRMVRGVAEGKKLIVVLGFQQPVDCNEEDPRTKVATLQSDGCILTCDAFVSESAPTASADVGSRSQPGGVEIVLDRRRALARAMYLAAPDGVVLVLSHTQQRPHASVDYRALATEALWNQLA